MHTRARLAPRRKTIRTGAFICLLQEVDEVPAAAASFRTNFIFPSPPNDAKSMGETDSFIPDGARVGVGSHALPTTMDAPCPPLDSAHCQEGEELTHAVRICLPTASAGSSRHC
jgi:hypothetical protein